MSNGNGHAATGANPHAIDLLKYPILVLSIVVGMIVVNKVLGVKFENMKSLGPDGIEWADATTSALTELEARVNVAATQLAALEQRLPSQRPAERNLAESAAFTAAQTVSDETAQMARLSEKATDAVAKPLRGFVWIGNYDGSWDHVQLARPDTGQPIEARPEDLLAGTEYKVRGNLVVREGLPANDAKYFRAQANLGALPRGTTVRLIAPPVAIDREYAVQYWASVEMVPAS